jgi:hypothetical protein
MLGFSIGRPIFQVSEDQAHENLKKLVLEGIDSVEIFIHRDFFGIPDLFARASRFDISGFKKVSIHAPAIAYGADPNTTSIIKNLSTMYETLGAEDIIVHPIGVTNWEVFGDLKEHLLIENMDSVKDEGQDVEDMERYLSESEAGMVLDIQHTYSIDRSMALTDRLIERFRDKIKEVHISAWENPNIHIPLYDFSDRDLIGEQLRKLPGVNVIMEGITSAAFDTSDPVEMLKKETDFIRQFIV